MGPGAEKLQNVWRYEDEEAAADGDLDEANSSHVQLCTTGLATTGMVFLPLGCDNCDIPPCWCRSSSHGVSAVVTGKSSCLVRSQSRLLAGSRQQFHNNTSPAAAARTPARDGHISSLKEIWQG